MYLVKNNFKVDGMDGSTGLCAVMNNTDNNCPGYGVSHYAIHTGVG